MTVLYIDDTAVPLIEGGGGGGGCFAPDTLISIESGFKPISDIEVGDSVWAFNELGHSVLSTVTETFYHPIDKIYRVEHEAGTLDITPNHWVLKEDGTYQELKDFKVGDNLLTNDNQLSKINSIEYLRDGEVYNFKVSHVHSYIANGVYVHNGGGGGKGGGSGTETPNNLFSTDILLLTLGLGEGPVYRINPNGPQDIEFNEGNIEDLLVEGVVDDEKFFYYTNTGTISQQRIPLFGDYTFIPQRLQGTVELKKGNADGVPRSAVDKQDTSPTALTACKFYFIIGGLQKQNDKGDVLPETIEVKVTLYNRDGTEELATQTRTINGKTNVAFSFDIYLAVPTNKIDDAGYKFTVEKTNADTASSKVQASVTFQGWTEIIEEPIAYTRTATVGYALKAFAEHKGGMPAITQIVKGLIVKVPSNYNQPILENGDIDWREVEVSATDRTNYGYSQQKTGTTLLTGTPVIYNGLWDGQFVFSWTQNPAWIIYDMLTNKSYGLGIPEENVDKFSFYDAAVYNDACDVTTGEFVGVAAEADGTNRYKPRGVKTKVTEVLVGIDAGLGVLERRFIYDGVISDQKQVMDAINIVSLSSRSILFYSGGKIMMYQDKPDNMPSAVFNETNIIAGTMNISGISEESLITGVDVTYIDPTLHFRREVLRIDDPKALRERNSIENIAKIDLDGVARKSQAIRAAQYVIADSKYSRRKVGFKTGIEASELTPGSIIAVSQRATSVGWGYGGIVSNSSTASNTAIYLEHIGNPSITSSFFTANTDPLILRVSSHTSGLVDAYIISNTSFNLSNTANVTGGAEVIRVEALSKWDHPSKTFNAFSGGWGTFHTPSRYDTWSIGTIANPTDIFTAQSDKLFRIINMKREPDETVFIEAREYISNVYVDSDTLINYKPLAFTDLFSPLQAPPAPMFELRAVPKRDLDGSVYTDIDISFTNDFTGYSNETRTDFFHAPPFNTRSLVSNTTPQASRDIIKVHMDDFTDILEGESVTLMGKNGFTTEIGRSKILVTGYDIVDIGADEEANGYIELSLTGLNNLQDINFGTHVLAVNDTFDFGGLKGNDKITLPINSKDEGGTGDAAGLLGFIGSDTRVTQYSANVTSYNASTNTIKILNDHSGSTTIHGLLPDPPFYIKVPQVIDHRYFANNSLYVTGTHLDLVRSNTATISNLIDNHVFKQPLGVSLRHTGFVEVFINGGTHSDFTLEKGLDNLSNSQVSINLSTLPTSISNLDIRVTANVYTVPILERGDNITWNAGNVYGISDSTFDIAAPSYDAALTANGIYRVTLSDNIKSNVATAFAINITEDPIGTVGNLDLGSKTFTFDYNHLRYRGLLNLANNGVYTTNTPVNTFIPLNLESGSKRVINRAEVGIHSVRARNVTKYGRRSPFTTKSVSVRPIPIKAVSNLAIAEELYKDSTLGVSTRIMVSFDHITGQEVTDYEISYKISGDIAGDLTSFNTVKVSAAGVDEDGKIRIKIDNIERGLSSNPNAIVVRVIPLNKNIRGSVAIKQASITGKLAPPKNVVNFAVGQASDTLVMIWRYVIDPITGDNYDLDLLEVQIKKVEGSIATDQATLLDLWPRAQEVAIVDARTNRVVIDIDQYGQYSYLVRTKDTSGIFSTDIVAASFTSQPVSFSKTYQIFSEDTPGVPLVVGVHNSNNTESAYASFYSSNTGGLSYAKADSLFDSSVVDNANGSSSGWSVIGGSPTDLRALENAEYVTQIRDLGNTLTASIQLELVGSQALKSTWLDYSEQIGGDQVTEAASGSGKLKDVDFSGTLGIGEILGSSNTGAATVTYHSENKTLVSGLQGSFPANVYGIVAIGNYDGDDSNANVFSLIAGVSNDNEIILGDSWYANGMSTGSNGFANLEVAGSSYKLVNLKQWLDLSEGATFYGTSGIVTTNTEVRYATTSPYFANGNVDSSAFTSVAGSDGFENFVTGARTFRYFQFRYKVNNSDPTQAELILDKFNYKITLDERLYTEIVTVDTLSKYVDYSQMAFTQIPKVTGSIVSASSNQLAQPQVIILDRGLGGANISVYFSNGVSAHNIGGPSGILPQVDFAVTGV